MESGGKTMNVKNLIKNLNRLIAGLIATIMCLILLPSVDVKAEQGSSIFTYGDYTVEYDVVNEWDGYQNIEIKLTNTGSEPIYNWALND